MSMSDYYKEEVEELAVERTLIDEKKRQIGIQKSIIGDLDYAVDVVQSCQKEAPKASKELAERYCQILKLLGRVRGLHESTIKDLEKAIVDHREIVSNIELYLSEFGI